ncbi:hypothetical protein GTZ97_12375 [Aquabacterium fontiphilum]|uniref:hypothetical protein n=1 Tax=Aquabacterium fontiphilum TaxID=450365 RepID=UPI0013782CFF|nr:hypothetical protein [Aquabacterium fontiphilum]NBD21460.1 hypothetical protein [Aquabacterium fontiphilum]
MDPVYLLTVNAALQVLVSSLLGTLMLVPMQPWGKRFAARMNMKSLLATHIDWYMLAFMQWGAAFIMSRWDSTASLPIAALLVFGGWTNALPYLLRGFGINAFVLGGDTVQRIAAAIGGLSVLAILTAWSVLCWQLLHLH